jgi:formyltetrahydrofolate-dependent phosphoribosylglycinamide formyltransferase
MFERLQKKWKVKGWQFVLIMFTFAIGGSATGLVAKKLMPVFAIGPTWLWVITYILLVTLIWPLAVLLVSIPLGQFPFFSKYIKKIGRRMGISRSGVKRETSNVKRQTSNVSCFTHIAIFASGAGSNAQKIIDHFRNHSSIKVSLIISNNAAAGVLQIAAREGIPFIVIKKEKFFHGDSYIKEIKEHKIDFIVLAGFLWKIPAALINIYPGRIINIHPALLPKYGGKGMYGQAVHQAVINAGENESGITIHYVDEAYDHGKTIFQAHCPVLSSDTAESLAQRIHKLEHEHYSKVIEKILKPDV